MTMLRSVNVCRGGVQDGVNKTLDAGNLCSQSMPGCFPLFLNSTTTIRRSFKDGRIDVILPVAA